MEKLDKRITLCISSEMYEKIKYFANKHYFSNIQDYIRMSLLINLKVDEEKENDEE